LWKSISAINNLNKVNEKISSLSKWKIDINLIKQIQSDIVDNTWNIEDITKWEIRQFDICVVDSIKSLYWKDWVVFIAPKWQDLHNLFNDLFSILDLNIPIIIKAILFKCFFVVLHPFWDWNGRTSRVLFNLILKKYNWHDNHYTLPISYTINKNKKRYYEELFNLDKIILEKAFYETSPYTDRYIAVYDDVNIYRNLDYSKIINYFLDLVMESLVDWIIEFHWFKTRWDIYKTLLNKYGSFTMDQQNHIEWVIKAQLNNWTWWTKTEKKLSSFFDDNFIKDIKQEILLHKDQYIKFVVENKNLL
jgi:hypothetical protein